MKDSSEYRLLLLALLAITAFVAGSLSHSVFAGGAVANAAPQDTQAQPTYAIPDELLKKGATILFGRDSSGVSEVTIVERSGPWIKFKYKPQSGTTSGRVTAFDSERWVNTYACDAVWTVK